MKRILTCLLFLVLLGFVAVPAQALIGVPDNVPGNEILVPFFYVSMPDPLYDYGDDNTLITITEVKGVATTVMFAVFDRDGKIVHNQPKSLTARDVFTIDILTIILDEMSSVAKADLEIDTDGDGTHDHWAGYITIEIETPTTNENNLISHVYQVDLPAGRAVSYNPPRLEHPSTVADPRQVDADGNEVYSANALWIGKNLLEGKGVPGLDASFFRMMFRYNIVDEGYIGGVKRSENRLIIWVDPMINEIPVPYPPHRNIHTNFYDEEEYMVSSNIGIDHQLNILDITWFLPNGLFFDYPKAGWIDIRTPDASGNGFDANRSWIGYSWQINSEEVEVFKEKKKEMKEFKGKPCNTVINRWDVIQPADREVDDVP